MDAAQDFRASLLAIVGPAGIVQGESLALRDPGAHPGNLGARLMVLPACVAEVARVLALCDAARVAVVPQGGRTGLAGGAVSGPGQLVLALDRMAAIEDVDVEGRSLVVQAGCTLSALAGALAPHGLSPGIDLGARDSCTVGGLASTNAGGMEAFRHGTVRQRVLGLEAVLADGTVLSDLARVRKANTGYDLKQLFIGAEGTLGVVTRLALEPVPLPGPSALALVACAGMPGALALMRGLQGLPGATLLCAELMWRNHFESTARELGLAALLQVAEAPLYVLFELAAPTRDAASAALEEALAAALGRGQALDALLAQSERERRDMWRVREDWAVDRLRPGGLWFDVSAPVSRLASWADGLLRRVKAHDPALEVFLIGHLGDGNLHVTVNAPWPVAERYGEIAPLVYAGLEEIGGAFSAEHGIGLEKRHALATHGPAGKLALMRRVKAVFDPNGIMNPGKVL